MTEEQKRQRAERIGFWQPHIEAWETSGQTALGYCKAQGLKHHQFTYWQSQLAPKTKRVSRPSDAQQFIEITTKQPPDEQLLPTITIKTRLGFVITLSNNSTREQLAMVLEALQESSC